MGVSAWGGGGGVTNVWCLVPVVYCRGSGFKVKLIHLNTVPYIFLNVDNIIPLWISQEVMCGLNL